MFLRSISLMFCSMALSATAFADSTFTLVNRDGRQAEYTGVANISGRFERRQDAETLDWRGDRICFYPDAETRKILPEEAQSHQNLRFCFSNHRAAAVQLKLAGQPTPGNCGFTGTATVAISRYVVESGDGDLYDQAWLDKVMQQGPVSNIRCN